MGLEYKECVGKCPHCDSEDIDYGTMELVGDYAFYPVGCNDCEKESTEYYTLQYDNTGYEK